MTNALQILCVAVLFLFLLLFVNFGISLALFPMLYPMQIVHKTREMETSASESCSSSSL